MTTDNTTLSTLEAQRKNEKRLNIDAAYCVAKAVHHAKASEFYLVQTVNELQAHGTTKKLSKDLAHRAQLIPEILFSKMATSESKDVLREELEDPLFLDQINDAFIALEPSNRTIVEDFIADLLNKQKQAA